VDGEDFVVDGITKYDGYGDECRGIKFAGVAIFQDVEEKLIFPFPLSTHMKPMSTKAVLPHF